MFKIDGQETTVRISNKGLTFHHKRKISCFNLKTKSVSRELQIYASSDDYFHYRDVFVPSSYLVNVKCSVSTQPDTQNSGGYGTFR